MAFKIYKKSQGKNTRLWSVLVASVIVIAGCWRLYAILDAVGVNLWVETMVPVGVFVVLAILIGWLANKKNIADFMISAEGELKKVSWSSRKELVESTIIVISVVIIFAVLLGVTDLVFKLFFSEVVGI